MKNQGLLWAKPLTLLRKCCPPILADEGIKAQRGGVTGPRHPAYRGDVTLVSQVWLLPAFPSTLQFPPDPRSGYRAQPSSLHPQGQLFAAHPPHCSLLPSATFQEIVVTPQCHWLGDPEVYFSQFPSSFCPLFLRKGILNQKTKLSTSGSSVPTDLLGCSLGPRRLYRDLLSS